MGRIGYGMDGVGLGNVCCGRDRIRLDRVG